MSGTSSVDPSMESAAILSRLQSLSDATTYNGIPQGFELPTDSFGRKSPYRDFEQGSLVRSAGERLIGVGEQAQPHIWGFQVHHFAPTRKGAFDLATATGLSLIGWAPSSASDPINVVFFTTYDEFSKAGERIGYVRTGFYETTLGQNPDLAL